MPATVAGLSCKFTLMPATVAGLSCKFTLKPATVAGLSCRLTLMPATVAGLGHSKRFIENGKDFITFVEHTKWGHLSPILLPRFYPKSGSRVAKNSIGE